MNITKLNPFLAADIRQKLHQLDSSLSKGRVGDETRSILLFLLGVYTALSVQAGPNSYSRSIIEQSFAQLNADADLITLQNVHRAIVPTIQRYL